MFDVAVTGRGLGGVQDRFRGQMVVCLSQVSRRVEKIGRGAAF